MTIILRMASWKPTAFWWLISFIIIVVVLMKNAHVTCEMLNRFEAYGLKFNCNAYFWIFHELIRNKTDANVTLVLALCLFKKIRINLTIGSEAISYLESIFELKLSNDEQGLRRLAFESLLCLAFNKSPRAKLVEEVSQRLSKLDEFSTCEKKEEIDFDDICSRRNIRSHVNSSTIQILFQYLNSTSLQ